MTDLVADEEPVTKRSWGSLWSVLIVQAQNAFNDNFVKFVLLGLAVVVAEGTAIGDNIEFVLAAMIPLPFVLLAPVAGWFSDRFAKSKVIKLCLVIQCFLFLMIVGSLMIRSVELALVGYFLLAVQSTLFSPAKQGILKELIGSKKLGFANGFMQMLTMAGILGGMAVGGEWFDQRLVALNESGGGAADRAWRAATVPVIAIGVASLIPLILGLFIQRTPDRPEKRFETSIIWSHFFDLQYVFSQKALRVTAILIAFYWVVANFMGVAFISLAKVLNPDTAKGGVTSDSGRMLMVVGAGLIVGSLLVSFLTRNGNKRGLSVIGGAGMALGFVGMGAFEPETMVWFGSVALTGFFSGFFIVPLNAHLQDQIDEAARGRVLSALNLMGAFSGMVAIGASSLFKMVGIPFSAQMFLFVPLLIVASVFIKRLLKTLKRKI